LRPSGLIRWQNTADVKPNADVQTIRPAAATSPEVRLPEVFRAVAPDLPRPK
jgi:hypothetical protein